MYHYIDNICVYIYIYLLKVSYRLNNTLNIVLYNNFEKDIRFN